MPQDLPLELQVLWLERRGDWAAAHDIAQDMPDPEFDDLPLAHEPGAPRSDVALVLNRGFAGTNSAVLVRAARQR